MSFSLTTPRVVATRADLKAARADLSGTVALVMTMGALHEGHLSLVRRAHELADHVVVSIFVNPTQFAPGEDFDRYPRTLDADLAALGTVGADLVFTPQPDEVYLTPAQFTLDPGPIAQDLEGQTRPTHLAGVALVVTKVMNLVRPDFALFGQKDAQQLAMVRLLVKDTDLPVQIVSVPISRDTDGVARSSRNAYLSPDERSHAQALSRALQVGATAVRSGSPLTQAVADVETTLQAEPGVQVDYVAARSVNDWALVDDRTPAGTQVYLLVAAYVGSTRLIDNTVVTIPEVTR